MTTILVSENTYGKELKKIEKQYPNITILETTFTGIEESHPIVFRIPDGTFYGHVTEDRLENAVTGYADDLKIQTARIFSVEMKTYVSEPVYRKYVKQFLKRIEKMDTFNVETIERDLKKYIKSRKEKNDKVLDYHVLNPLKMALIKTTKGPSLSVLMTALGKEETMNRMVDYLTNYRYRI